MLIEIGFRPNNLFVSNAAKHFLSPSPSYTQMSTTNLHGNKHDLKYFQSFFNSKKKKIKKSMTMPYSSDCDGNADDRPSISNCLDSIENDLNRMERNQSLNPFKSIKARKEAIMKEKASRNIIEDVDNTGLFVNSNRLAIEFPMILNVGSIYSSHVVLYLDPWERCIFKKIVLWFLAKFMFSKVFFLLFIFGFLFLNVTILCFFVFYEIFYFLNNNIFFLFIYYGFWNFLEVRIFTEIRIDLHGM